MATGVDDHDLAPVWVAKMVGEALCECAGTTGRKSWGHACSPLAHGQHNQVRLVENQGDDNETDDGPDGYPYDLPARAPPLRTSIWRMIHLCRRLVQPFQPQDRDEAVAWPSVGECHRDALTRGACRGILGGEVRRFLACAVIAASITASFSFGATVSPLRPGDRVGRMTLAKATVATADEKLFDTCDPVILRNGRYRRQCGLLPRVRRLFIGYGVFAVPREIGRLWTMTTWLAWLDGHRVALQKFGISDRTLYNFPPAGGKDVTLREWRLMLLGVTPGRHTLRYRWRDGAGTTDAAWTFTVKA